MKPMKISFAEINVLRSSRVHGFMAFLWLLVILGAEGKAQGPSLIPGLANDHCSQIVGAPEEHGRENVRPDKFDAHQAGRHVHRVREQLLAVETLFGDDVAFLTQANQVKDRLTDINAANVDLHGGILLCSPSSCHI